MAKKVGLDCKLYYCATALDGESNTPALADWNEIDNVRDLTLNLSTGEADVSTRASSWRQTKQTLKEGSIDFEMLWDTDDEAFSAIQDAWEDGEEIALAAMDGDIEVAGAEGLASNFAVTNFSRNEPLEEGVTVSVTVKPSSYTEWYVVTGS